MASYFDDNYDDNEQDYNGNDYDDNEQGYNGHQQVTMESKNQQDASPTPRAGTYEIDELIVIGTIDDEDGDDDEPNGGQQVKPTIPYTPEEKVPLDFIILSMSSSILPLDVSKTRYTFTTKTMVIMKT